MKKPRAAQPTRRFEDFEEVEWISKPGEETAPGYAHVFNTNRVFACSFFGPSSLRLFGVSFQARAHEKMIMAFPNYVM